MIASLTELTDKASELIADGRNDEAIDVLRSAGPPDHPEQCVLLSRAYFQRGDERGDVYSSQYFAQRALEMGAERPLLHAIIAVGAFRKGRYHDAVGAFSQFATERSGGATTYLYALALMHIGDRENAQQWIRRALDEDPDNRLYRDARDRIEKRATNGSEADIPHVPPTGNMYASVIEQLRLTDDDDIDAPYTFNAVSKLRGHGMAAKDFHWLDVNIPCQQACPAGTNIPEYLASIYKGDYDRAYRINLWDNVFPAVLGRVCSRPCESECRHGWEDLGDPVAICFSKRSAADFKSEARVILDKLYPDSGKSVAVIGAGVAGLAAARNLALLGHGVTVYEMHAHPGGMMNQGIPIFRLPRDYIDREIDQIRALGVDIICNTRIGKDIAFASLQANHDAVVMAAGTLRPNIIDLPGKDLTGIRHGLDFLLEANDTDAADVGENVIVIGGGFTAMDCARTALRLGAETVRMHEPGTPRIRVAYRRSQDEMLVTPGEVEELNHEGIPMDFMVSPVCYLGDDDGRVTGMRLIRTRLGEPDASGRRRPIEIPGSEFEIPADTVLLATGQFPETSWIGGPSAESLVGDDQWLVSGAAATTAVAGVFAAGDFATGALTLIDAIAHGKQCARDVDHFLTGEVRLIDVARVEDAGGPGRIREMDYVPLQPMPMIPLEERSLKAEVESGFTESLAVDETQRCYLCHYKYEIDPDKCIYCDWCIKAKPRPDCIVKVSSLNYDDAGRITGFNRAGESEDTYLIYINQEDCIRCNACVEACPVDCISVQKVSLRTATPDGTLCGYSD